MTVVYRGILQSAMPPYTMRCMACEQEWQPKSHTAHGLDKSATDHWKECSA